MDGTLFSSDLWKPALEKYTEVTGLTVELFDADGRVVASPGPCTPLYALFAEYGHETELFSECARRCLSKPDNREVVVGAEYHGLTVVGTSLALGGRIVGAAVAGYASAGFSQVVVVQRWAQATRVPFDRLWDIMRRQSPMPERRLKLHGELLQVLGDALLRENLRTRQSEEMAAQLKAADAAKDEFLAVLSHELRAPLAPILGWAGVLKKLGGSPQVLRAAEVIERNVLLQSRMIEDLLDMNLISHGSVRLDLRTQELTPLIRAALEPYVAEVERKSIRVAFADAEGPLCVKGDAGRLQQIFRNVVSNAVKFTPAGGSVRISIGREGQTAVIRIADSGEGIASEFLPMVFGMFKQQEHGTRREHEGLGIGLALVKRLTELHKGTVSVASAGAGKGAEVILKLPLVGEGPDRVQDAPDLAEPVTSLAGLTILVVDDSDDALESLQILLRQLGARVEAAHDGREALELARVANIDLVLCDLRMPRMDGYEFIRELNRSPSKLNPPVVAMSGQASEADRQRTRRAGFEAHIAKPFNEAVLVATVSAVVSRRKETRGKPLH